LSSRVYLIHNLDMSPSSLGDFLKAERERREESQRVFGARFGMSRAYLAQTEGGHPRWPKTYIPAIARALQLTEAELAEHAGVIQGETTDQEFIEAGSLSAEQSPAPTLRVMRAVEDSRAEAIALIPRLSADDLEYVLMGIKRLVSPPR
jgi:transcriptional regulator with XRE-family HTH domain